MKTSQWINRSHPPNLMNAVILLYINAAFAAFYALIGGGIYGYVQLAQLVGVGAGYGIANDKKWGYYLALVVAVIPLFLTAVRLLGLGIGYPLGLNTIFQVILIVLLLMKDSKEYVRIWFR